MYDFQEAAEIIKESRFEFDDISETAIATVIERYVDEIVDEINTDPEGYFRNNYRFWNDLSKEALKAENDLIKESREIEEEKNEVA